MKALSISGTVGEENQFEVLWEDTRRAFCRLRRDHGESQGYAFIPSPSSDEHPTLESINHLIHEYALRDYLDGAWALRPLDLVRERGRTMLIVEYTEGQPLSHLTHQAMETGQFLRLGVALSV